MAESTRGGRQQSFTAAKDLDLVNFMAGLRRTVRTDANQQTVTFRVEEFPDWPTSIVQPERMVGTSALKTDADLRHQIAELRKDQRNTHAAMHVIATYALIAGNLWLLRHYATWATYVFSFFFLGFMQYRFFSPENRKI